MVGVRAESWTLRVSDWLLQGGGGERGEAGLMVEKESCSELRLLLRRGSWSCLFWSCFGLQQGCFSWIQTLVTQSNPASFVIINWNFCLFSRSYLIPLTPELNWNENWWVLDTLFRESSLLVRFLWFVFEVRKFNRSTSLWDQQCVAQYSSNSIQFWSKMNSLVQRLLYRIQRRSQQRISVAR